MPIGRTAATSHSLAPAEPRRAAGTIGGRHNLFRVVWYAVSVLSIFSLLALLWGVEWEYSTRRYIQGFSDAIVPFSASPEEKVQAILNWMAHTPPRFDHAPASMADDRDPADTLNYASLLSVCGTATNAFINLANGGGLTARRLLLLNANRTTVHVVAEVLIDGRWIVVDPTFHTIFRGLDGQMLTAEQLTVPAVFHAATQSIPGYDPAYVFDRSVHIRLSRLGAPGRELRSILGVPAWEGSPTLSLILERESLETTVLFAIVAFFFLVVRTLLRWYGGARLGFRPEPIHQRLRRFAELLLEPAD
ncbi:MAG TPA: transglutaminase domain-containing protein [Candidatus Acidoferrales bacterium]|nr:transglutaminase domain-containing protein [Candidatus Acidoferrales bacterium]